MWKENLVRGLEKLNGEETKCEVCIQGKLTRAPFNSVIEGTSHILERLHVDLCGPMKVHSLGGSKYMLMIVDEFSRRYFVDFVKSKDEVKDRIKNIIERRENETGKRVKSVRSDNGSEFTNVELMNYYRRKGIKSERTTIHSPQSNGIAERANRTIISTARTLLIEAKLPLSFWAEAVSTAVYIHNVTPTATRKKTPLELWSCNKPTVKHLKIFGCKAFYHNDDINRNKFDVRAKPAVFVGYSRDRQAYRLYDLREKRIRESRDVTFIEEKMAYENEINNEGDIDEFEYIEIVGEKNPLNEQIGNNSEENLEGLNQNEEIVTLRNNIDDAVIEDQLNDIIGKEEQQEKKDEESKLFEGLRRSSRIRKPNPKYLANLVREEIPKCYKDVLKSKDKNQWIQAIKKELNSLEEHKTWKIVDRPKDVKALKSKWIFTLKENGEEVKHKARLVVDGSRLKFGINYEESYSPVMKTESFRTLLAIAAMKDLKTRFFDVETAYLNAELATAVYMNPPEGLEIEGGKILLVTGNLYGLPEAGRCWYEKLVRIFDKIGLQPCKADPCVFVNKNDDKFITVGMYVDDGIIISESEELMTKFFEQLKKEVKIIELKGKVRYLGIDIEEDNEGFLLGQTDYIEKILERYDMQNCKNVKTPGVPGLNLDEYENSIEINATLYQEMLGSIGYLVRGTRPDLAIIISKLSQYAKDPREIHFQAVKRVLRYVQGTKNYKLRIKRELGQLSLCSDASWCTTNDSKSFGGYIIKMGESTVGWKSNKQKLVALSTMESELISLCEAVCEGKWIISLLEELGQSEMINRPIEIATDSQSVIDWIKNPRVNHRNKHIARKYHFVKDERARGEIETKYVNSSELEADLMTKILSADIISKHLTSLGIIDDYCHAKGGNEEKITCQ